ncbi:MAG TPA: DNA polymerase I, partial [Candidatus Paenalcaligenes intestinipullorum]|nr:DNA polymerase I [Candidatus Paenalcaligenes intestinipullorum]
MKKTLLLVDGSSYLYRAYHAMPDLRNSLGDPTGAIYGVIAMMRKILQDYSPDYLACVFDAKGPTFRDELFSDYKANRSAMPTELRQQIEPIHQAVKALGWPVLCVPGVEADDIIGTLSVQATAKNIHTVISTGDKDMAQLVNDQVELINTMNNERQDVQGVKDRFGVWPHQIIDYLMLRGDSSDNIPGVAKVGEKTAQRWLNQYGSLDEIINHAAEIKGVVGQNLRDFIPQFELTRQLVTIKLDCALDEVPCITHLKPTSPDTQQLQALYETYGFRTWLRELTGDAQRIPVNDHRVGGAPAAAVTTDTQNELSEEPERQYQTITTEDALAQLWQSIQKAEIVALDTETTSLNAFEAEIVGVSVSTAPGQAAYIPLAHRGVEG